MSETPPPSSGPGLITPTQAPIPPSQAQHKAEQEAREGTHSIIKTIALLLAAPLVAVFITSFIFHSYEVYGPSMESTLQNGDRLIVLKAPRTWAKLLGNNFMPKRSQIIVFTRPDQVSSFGDTNKQLIKRVIALPGERVIVKDGVITVYNSEHPDGFHPDQESAYGIAIHYTEGDLDVTVGPHQIFVCGDNREHSLDSRSFGPIDSNSIVGTAEYRLFPLSKMQGF